MSDGMAIWLLQDVADRFPHRERPVQVRDKTELRQALWDLARKLPRVVTVGISDAASLQMGIGGDWAFIEHVVHDPWKAQMAVPRSPGTGEAKPTSVWFACGGDRSEIPQDFLIPTSQAIELVVEFYEQNSSPHSVDWQLS